ncbi:MAG: leucyl aminopeptidase, partial [Candidatus Thioglobus sp.]|nr:leucyl aminopeptidase [Candidatus Thioglobus sp.]MBT6967109.1 leucyl aminopeptidase [Candidatus Thioglobus sp.]
MEFSLINTQIQKFDGDMVVVFANSKIDFADDNVQQLIKLNHFESKPGSTLLLSLVKGFKAKQVLVVGLGELPNSAKNYIKALTSASAILNSTQAKSAMIEQVEIEGFDQGWRHRMSARVLKDSGYKVQQVGVQ